MKRDLAALADREFDLAVVGGGIFGIFAAWDAALRGLSVALVERRDFAHGASANCFKIVHGGIRYMQHGDLPRVRQSTRERTTWLRIAPHQVTPLPIVVPTFGHGLRGKELLAVGMKLYDLVTADRNRGLRDPARRIPPTRLLSRDEVLADFPMLDPGGLTGAALFHDGQMESPARLAWCVLRAAGERGAVAANYVEATGVLQDGGRAAGVRCRDALGGEVFDVRARAVLNATGGWAPRFLEAALGRPPTPRPTFSRDACLVVRRRPTTRRALALPGATRDPDAIVSRAARHLFLVPWREVTLVGVWHRVWEDDPDATRVEADEVRAWLDEVRASAPALAIDPAEVALTQCGLVLFGENRPGARDLSYGKRSRLEDHAREGVPGLVTLLGVRYTTARSDGARAVDRVFAHLGRPAPPSPTEHTPVYGGEIDDWASFERGASARRPAEADPRAFAALLRDHGSAHGRVLARAQDAPGALATLGGAPVLVAAAREAVEEEMAVRLADLVFRRTGLGTAGHPGEAALGAAADVMAEALGWDAARRAAELEDVRAAYPAWARAPEPEGDGAAAAAPAGAAARGSGA